MARINFKFADGFDDSYKHKQQQQEDDLLAFQFYVSFVSGEARSVYDLHPLYLAQYGQRMPWEVWPEKFGHLKPAGNSNGNNEQEADKLAKQVVNGETVDPIVANKNNASAEQKTPSGFENKVQHQKSSGENLPDQLRQEMETKLGADFSDVKIHNTTNDHALAAEAGAQAFTHGQDILFGKGKYDPNSTQGKELLAHELVHAGGDNNIIQQKAGDPDWVVNAISYNRSFLRNDRFIQYINQLFAICKDENLQLQAAAEQPFDTNFTYLVKATQRILFPSENNNGGFDAYDDRHDGKLGPATWKSMMFRLGWYPSATTVNAAYYTHFDYKLDYNGRDVMNLGQVVYESDYVDWITTSLTPDFDFAKEFLGRQKEYLAFYKSPPTQLGYIREGDSAALLAASILGKRKFAQDRADAEKKAQELGAVIQPTISDAFSDMTYKLNQEAEINIKNGVGSEFDPMAYENFLKQQALDKYNSDEGVRERAPDFLIMDMQEFVDKIDESEILSASKSTECKPEDYFEKELVEFMQQKEYAKSLTKPVQNYNASKGVEMVAPAANSTEAERMVRLIFSDFLMVRISARRRETFINTTNVEIDLGKLDSQDSTGAQMYMAKFAKAQEEEMAAYSDELKVTYDNEMQQEFALRQKDIQQYYSDQYNNYKKLIDLEYDLKLIEALRTGDPDKDRHMNTIRALQLNGEANLLQSQILLEAERQSLLDIKQQALQKQAQADMTFELNEITKKFQEKYTNEITAYSASIRDSIIVPKYRLERAYQNIKRKEEQYKKEGNLSSMVSDYKRHYIMEELFELQDEYYYIYMFNHFGPNWNRPSGLSGMDLIMLDSDGNPMSEPMQYIPKTGQEKRIHALSKSEYDARIEAEFYNYIFTREYFKEDGMPSISGLKAWAREWKKIVTERIAYWNTTWQPETFTSIAGYIISPGLGEILSPNSALHSILYRYERALENIENTLEMPEYKAGFWDEFGHGLMSLQLRHLIPFLGSIIEMAELYDVKRIADKKKENKPLSPDELILLDSYGMLQQIQTMNPSLWYSVGRGVGMAIPFIIEFVATIGVFSTAKMGVIQGARWVMQRSLVSAITRGVKQEVKVMLIRTFANIIGATIQAIANPQQYLKETVRNMIPQHMAYFDGEGIKFVTDDESISFWDAFKDAGIRHLFEFWTEHLGGFLVKLPGTIKMRVFGAHPEFADNILVNLISKEFPRLGKLVGKTKKQILDLTRKLTLGEKARFASILQKKGIGNIGVEYLEEFINARLNDLYDGKRFEISLEGEFATLVTVALISGPLMLAGGIKRIATQGNNTNGRARLQTRDPKTQQTQELEVDENLLNSIDAHAAKGILDLNTVAAEIGEYYPVNFDSNAPDADAQRARAIENDKTRQLLLAYYIQQTEKYDLVKWAVVDKAAGDVPTGFAILKLASGNMPSPADLVILEAIPEFAPVVAVIKSMANLKTDPAVAKNAQMLLSDMEFDATRRSGLAAQLMTGLATTNGQMTQADLEAEVRHYDRKMGLPEELRATMDRYRLPDESGAAFEQRIQAVEAKGQAFETWLQANKTNIETYRLDDASYYSFTTNLQNRPDASSYNSKTQQNYQQQKAGYNAAQENTENAAGTTNTQQAGVLTEFDNVDDMAVQGELLTELEGRFNNALFNNASENAVSETGNKHFKRTYDRRKKKIQKTLLNTELDNETKQKRVARYMRRLERSFKHHGKEGAINFEAAAQNLATLLNVEGQQRFIMSENGTITFGSRQLNLQELQQQLDAANALMEFNGESRRYYYTTRNLRNGKTNSTEVVITSNENTESEPFSNLTEQNNLLPGEAAGRVNADATLSFRVNAGPEVRLEEFAHIWLLVAEREQHPMFLQAMQQIKQTQAYRDLMNHPFYGPKGRASADPARFWAHEALAQAIRTNGQTLTEPQAKSWFEQFMKALWESVKQFLNRMGFNLPPDIDLSNMQVSELIRIAHGELTSGKQLSNATSKQMEDYLLGRTQYLYIENSMLTGKGKGDGLLLENFYGDSNFTEKELQAIDDWVEQYYVKAIKQESNAKKKQDRLTQLSTIEGTRNIINKVALGKIVENLGAVELQKIANENNWLLMQGLSLRFIVNGQINNASPLELDYILVSQNKIELIVSAKVSSKHQRFSTDRRHLQTLITMPTSQPDLGIFLSSGQFGQNKMYKNIERVEVTWNNGADQMSLADFQKKYTTDIDVNNIKIQGLSLDENIQIPNNINLQHTEEDIILVTALKLFNFIKYKK